MGGSSGMGTGNRGGASSRSGSGGNNERGLGSRGERGSRRSSGGKRRDTSNKTFGGTRPYNKYGYDHTGRAVGKAERDAWNRKRSQTGMGGERLRRHLNDEYDRRQYEQMFAGFGDMSGPEYPSGPSEADLLKEKNDRGISDLNKAYGVYLTASEDATKAANDQIDKSKADAALQGLEWVFSDEQKQELISNKFADLFSAEQWDTLQGFDKDFGTLRLEGDDTLTAYEYLITRGVATEDGEGEEEDGEGTQSKSNFGASTGGRPSSISLLDEEPIAQTSLLGA